MKKLYIILILFLLVASNVEAYHTTNKYGRYDDENPKNHKDIVIINNNYNIHDNIIIVNDRYSRYNIYYRRDSSKYTTYRRPLSYRYYNDYDRLYRYSRHYKDYRTKYTRYPRYRDVIYSY